MTSQKVGISDCFVTAIELLVLYSSTKKDSREGQEQNITPKDLNLNMTREFVTVSFVKLKNLGGMFVRGMAASNVPISQGGWV